MKKVIIFALALLGCVATYAQHPASFFDDMGNIRIETRELQESADTLVSLFHRSDDIVWSRIVYRIVDMRYKQNYQLYTPVIATDPLYSSLFRTMLSAIEQGMPIYAKSFTQGDVRPYFNEAPIEKSEIPTLLDTDVSGEGGGDPNLMLLNYDKANDKLVFNDYSYEGFVRNQLKFMIQEVVFFDRHYSRLYSKIMAIAPMYAKAYTKDGSVYHELEGKTPMEALYDQILFWVPYDTFRPYMAQQYVTPRGNDSKRVTFDDFFSLKLYSSYLVGINNIYSRMIPEVSKTYDEVQKEQQKIETELLKVEQDMWEY